MDDQIKEFFEQCQALNGQVHVERPAWNDEATVQAIRHFSICVTDDNPLWIDKDYAEASPHRGITAPPAFITSVKYPILHGANMAVPMFNLANRLELVWQQKINAGDQLTGTLKQTGVTHGRDRRGRDIIYIETQGTYQNQHDELVCESTGVLAWVARDEQEKKDRESWKIHEYSPEESKALEEAILARTRTGNRKWTLEDLQPGVQIPDLVHPPLTTGDIVCWEAANGPAYRAGNLGFKDAHAKPLSTVVNPVTGWRVNRVQSHGDHLLAHSRGMPGPFDSGVMRFAWVSVLVTDWMGDWAHLKRLRVNVVAPLLYGDAMTTSGTIVNTRERLEELIIDLRIEAKNQRGELISTGEAQVSIPHEALKKQEQSPYELLKPTPTPSNASEQEIPERISDLVEKHATDRPTSLAVCDHEHSLNQKELSERSNQLAHRLIESGAANNIAVAVMLPRGIDWITSILAISKAGAIYVPIDPGQPGSRRNFMIREAGTRILITSSSLVARKERSSLEVIYLDEEAASLEEGNSQSPDCPMDSRSIAYVMFTSGSTGKPKGVAVTYDALACYLKSLRKNLPLQPSDRYLNTATFSFSASIRQCFHPLAEGIAQVVANDSEQKDPLKLARLVTETKATVWDTVPSAWDKGMSRILESFEREKQPAPLESIRRILLTGEALAWGLPRRWWNQFNPKTEIINL